MENWVRCDNCEKFEHVTECHGWFTLKTWITKPTASQLKMYQAITDVPESVTAAEKPPLIGGDLCSIRCLTEFIDGNRLLLEASGLTEEEPEDEIGFTPDDE